jgi:hypothetical protein
MRLPVGSLIVPDDGQVNTFDDTDLARGAHGSVVQPTNEGGHHA